MSNRLPAAFADLEPLCECWLHDTEAARNRARISADMARIRAFYDAVMPRFDAMIQHLNRFPLGALPAAEENLLNLAFAFVEASAPVERFNSPIVTKTFPPERFLIHEDLGRSGGW